MERARRPGEEDVDRDDAQALSRAADTGDDGTFVGRTAGQDVGYAEETGAERRAAVEDRE
jgi:hypothetical protein